MRCCDRQFVHWTKRYQHMQVYILLAKECGVHHQLEIEFGPPLVESNVHPMSTLFFQGFVLSVFHDALLGAMHMVINVPHEIIFFLKPPDICLVLSRESRRMVSNGKSVPCICLSCAGLSKSRTSCGCTRSPLGSMPSVYS